MISSLLTEAKMEVEEDYKTMSAKTDCPTREEKDGADSPQPRRAEGKCKCSGDDIVHKVSEYLFDLWDANCMEDYHKINNFEERAALSFDPEVEEFTFAQEALHKEFCSLFEEITEGFIKEHGYSLKDFYDESRRLMQAKEQEEGNTVERDPWKDPPDPKEEADEIIEVIYQVADFRMWAEAMREKAKRKLRSL